MVAEVETKPAPLSASATGDRFLRVRLKGKVVDRVLLTRSRFVIGRSPRADIVLDKAAGVSREHAHILIVDDEVLIEDLSSRNGTFVNGRICQRRTLEHGDRISIGSYRLRYRDPSQPAGPGPTAQERIAALLQIWNDAAIVGRPDACALCAAEFDEDAAENIDAVQPDEPLAARDSAASASPTANQHEALAEDDSATVANPAAYEHETLANSESATAAAAAAHEHEALANSDSATAANLAEHEQKALAEDEPGATVLPDESAPAGGQGGSASDDPDGLAGTDAMPHLYVADACPTVPSAIVLVPDGMRQPPPPKPMDDAVPSGLASTGDTMEGMFPELFLVPGGTAYLPQHTNHRVQAATNSGTQADATDDASGAASDTRPKRFRRKLKAARRLPTPRKR